MRQRSGRWLQQSKSAFINNFVDADRRQCAAACTFEEHHGAMQLTRGNRGKASDILLVFTLLEAALDRGLRR